MYAQDARDVEGARDARGGDADTMPSVNRSVNNPSSRPPLERPTSRGAPAGCNEPSLTRVVSGGDQSSTAASESDHDASRSSGGSRKVPTQAEKRREQRLREDAMALIFSPQLVQCQRCGAKIKLSLKSAWDPFHWTKHRARCLKRPDDVVMALKADNEKTIRASPPAKKLTTPRPRKSRDLEPTPPPLTPSTMTDDSFSDHDAPSSPIAPLRHAVTTVFSEAGQPSSYTWTDHSSIPVYSHYNSEEIRSYLPASCPINEPPAPPCLYPRHNLDEDSDDDDAYIDDWTIGSWRPITFQESKVRFSLS